MANDITRLRYFTLEFLQEGDFKAEQAYHRRLRYLHNRWLHTLGIAFGLDVKATANALDVTVDAGMALVKATEDGEELAKEAVLTSQRTITLLPGPGNAVRHIVISFQDTDGKPDPQGNNMRTSEGPNVRAVDTPPDNERDLILAKITLDGAGTGIQLIDKQIGPANRKIAGMRGDVEATNVLFSIANVNNLQWPSMRGVAANRLKITADDQVEVTGNLTLGAGKTVDGVDVSTHNHTGGAGGQINHTSLSNADSTTGHVTGGNAHNHTGGAGATIPWAGVTPPNNLLLITACARVEVGGTLVVQRPLGGIAVIRVSGMAAGAFEVTWTAGALAPVPMVLITLEGSTSLTVQLRDPTTTPSKVIFDVRNNAGTRTDPTAFHILIF